MVRSWTIGVVGVAILGCAGFAYGQQSQRTESQRSAAETRAAERRVVERRPSSAERQPIKRRPTQRPSTESRAEVTRAPVARYRIVDPGSDPRRNPRIRTVSRVQSADDNPFEELPSPIEPPISSGNAPFVTYDGGPPFPGEHFGGPHTGCDCGPTCAPACRCVRCRCRYYVFGDYLAWRPRDFDVAYAVLTDSQQEDMMQRSPVSQVRGDYSSGYRAGIGIFLSDCSKVEVVFTGVESNDNDSLNHPTFSGDPNNRLQGLVIDQGVGNGNAPEDWDCATASLDIQMQTLDINYRWQKPCCCYDVFVGARIGRLDQEFHAHFKQLDTSDLGFRNVWTEIEFNGGGPRVGMQGHRPLFCGWSVYGLWAASLLAGDFDAELLQTSDDALPDDPPIERNTSISQYEIVPILEFELGIRFECGRWTMSGGYAVNAWFNVLTTDQFIGAVQSNNVLLLNEETVYFDGFNFRIGTQF